MKCRGSWYSMGMRITAMYILLVLFCAGMSLTLTPPQAEAITRVSDSRLTVVPAAPGPLTPVTIKITNTADVPVGSSVQWFVDDIELTDNQNSQSVSITAKAMGESTVVKAQITKPGSGTETLTATIDPTRVDLIIQANNHTPYFYRGRSLPSGNSQISATALVFADTAGPFTYQWRVNNEAQHNTLGKNNNQIVFTPGLDFSMNVEVQVFNQAGTLVAQAAEKIPLVDPEIHFYEANTLHGLLPNVLKNPYYFLTPEITIKGEPYYFAADTDKLDVKWTVDGVEVPGDAEPLEMSLTKTKDSGRAELGLRLINTAGHLQKAQASLPITY